MLQHCRACLAHKVSATSFARPKHQPLLLPVHSAAVSCHYHGELSGLWQHWASFCKLGPECADAELINQDMLRKTKLKISMKRQMSESMDVSTPIGKVPVFVLWPAALG